MGEILFVISFIFYWCISLFIPKNNSYGGWYLLGSGILATITTSIGTSKGCNDNWISYNIGTRGACSYHGGVTTRLNDFGVGFLIAIGISLLSLFLYTYIQEYREKRKKSTNLK